MHSFKNPVKHFKRVNKNSNYPFVQKMLSNTLRQSTEHSSNTGLIQEIQSNTLRSQCNSSFHYQILSNTFKK